jgi:hypothetical protein
MEIGKDPAFSFSKKESDNKIANSMDQWDSVWLEIERGQSGLKLRRDKRGDWIMLLRTEEDL